MREPIPAEVIDRASEWFITIREPEVSSAEREQFADWLRMSPVNVRAYLEVACIWGDVAQADIDVGEWEPTDLVTPGSTNVISFDSTRPLGHPTPPKRTIMFRSRLAAAMVAGVVVTFGGLFGWWHFAQDAVYTAAVGEQRLVTLDDGSVVRLNSRSKMRVKLTDTVRVVELLAGQALFEVSKDPHRPFLVQTENALIQAVGTSFDVYHKEEGTFVTVVEGRVTVEQFSGSALRGDRTTVESQVTPIRAGEQILVRNTGTIEPATFANVAAATSWVQHELVFTGESLREVVAEFNRYSRRTIILVDPELAEMRINAVFHSTNPASLLKYVQRLEGVQVEESDSEIRISHRNDGS